MKLLHSSKVQSQSMKKETKQIKQLISTLLALLIAFTAVFAVPQQTKAATKKLTLAKSKVTLYAGEYTTIKIKSATGLKNKKVTYKSSKKSVATVSSKGVVTAKKKGTATITVTSASDKTVKATFKVTVKAKPSKSSITLKKKKATLTIGKTTTIKIKKVKGLSSKEVTYKSSDKSVATVSKTGVVKAKKKGTATITVTSAVNKKVKAKFTVTVTGKKSNTSVFVTSIDTHSSITLKPNSGTRLAYNISPINATNQKVTATSSNPVVAKVTDVTDGEVGILAITEGTTTITLKSADGKATKKVKVNVKKSMVLIESIGGVELNPYGSLLIPKGASYKVNINITPSNATNKKLVWKTTNPKAATVNQNGVITFVNPNNNWGNVGECWLIVTTTDGSNVGAKTKIWTAEDPLMTWREALAEIKAHPEKECIDFYTTVADYEDLIAYAKELGDTEAAEKMQNNLVDEFGNYQDENGFMLCSAWVVEEGGFGVGGVGSLFFQ